MIDGFDLAGFAGDVSQVDWSAPGGALTLPESPALQFSQDSLTELGQAGTVPPPRPGGLGDFASKLGAGIGKEFTTTPLKAFSETLGLGATGFGISNQLRTAGLLNRQTQQIEKGQKAAQAAAAPAVSFGQETLAAAAAGKLPGPMQAAVEQWKQQAKADMRARFASMGLGNSTDIQSEEAKIDLMGESMIAQLLQGQEQLGLEGLRTGVSAATGGAESAQQQQVLLTNLIAGANQQLARLGATS